ncbi:MarR family winged helix-turn-helix transcriptional regulator [Bacilliculturomica massiliensis]|uniref:MarR family winged helix-turn-helix transcriptional regulator n=1 Tax=Bacilliculturomica massiliensis TaxID=1917867 RepID=UPI00102FF5D2|nr:MarR family transcriptional regulator [Bacilliculturomica massiliensis]
MNPNIGIFRRCEAFYIRTKMEKYGLSPLESKLLMLLKEKRYHQDELGCQMNLDKGRIARSVSLLEDKGLIQRETNARDKRQKFVSLSDKGREMLTQISKVYKDWDDICYSGFTEEEKRLHQEFLSRIAENAVEYRRSHAEKYTGPCGGSSTSQPAETEVKHD